MERCEEILLLAAKIDQRNSTTTKQLEWASSESDYIYA
jgi:hypothetical protein